MKNDTLDKANKFRGEMIKEAEEIYPQMKNRMAGTTINDTTKSEDTWENVKASVSTTADTLKEKTEATINKADNRLDRMARQKEIKEEAKLWQEKEELDILDD